MRDLTSPKVARTASSSSREVPPKGILTSLFLFPRRTRTIDLVVDIFIGVSDDAMVLPRGVLAGVIPRRHDPPSPPRSRELSAHSGAGTPLVAGAGLVICSAIRIEEVVPTYPCRRNLSRARTSRTCTPLLMCRRVVELAETRMLMCKRVGELAETRMLMCRRVAVVELADTRMSTALAALSDDDVHTRV